MSANSQKWDELWEKNPFTVYTDLKTKRWATKVKRVGDRLKEKANKLGNINEYPPELFGHMTVLDYYDLVQTQADHYTERAIKAEQKLRDIKHYAEEQLKNNAGVRPKRVLELLEES